MPKQHQAATQQPYLKQWLIIGAITLAALVAAYRWVPLNIGEGLGSIDAGDVTPDRFEKAVVQAESLTTMLQGLALSMFVLVGLRFKDFKVGAQQATPVTIFLLIVFFACEFFCAYYAYWVRVSLTAEVAAGQPNLVHLLTALSYQGTALILTALSVIAVLIHGASAKD